MTSLVKGRGGPKILDFHGISILIEGFSPPVNQMVRRTDPIRDVRPIARR
jgi:hypothetical protein